MWPVLFKVGNFKIGTFGLLVAIGFFAAYWVGIRKARKEGLSEDRFANLVVVSLLFGILGAKALHVIVYLGQAPVSELLFSRSGLVFYGGLLAGMPAAWFCARRNGWNPAVVADIAAVMIPLGHFFGRIGCFFNGCCYGRVCPAWIGVQFPRIVEDGNLVGSEAYYHQYMRHLVQSSDLSSLPVYPTQLFSAVGALATFLLLSYYLYPRRRWAGQVALAYLVIYSVLRFCVEMLRDDPRGAWPGGLSTSQGISVVLLLAALLLWAPVRRWSLHHAQPTGGESQ